MHEQYPNPNSNLCPNPDETIHHKSCCKWLEQALIHALIGLKLKPNHNSNPNLNPKEPWVMLLNASPKSNLNLHPEYKTNPHNNHNGEVTVHGKMIEYCAKYL